MITSFRPAIRATIPWSAVEGVWVGEPLARPRTMMLLPDGNLLVADQVLLHVISPDGARIRSVGGQGDGPGEFRDIAGVGLRGDTLVVTDRTHQRATTFSLAGEVLGTLLLRPPSDLTGLRPGRIAVLQSDLVHHLASPLFLAVPRATFEGAGAFSRQDGKGLELARADGQVHRMVGGQVVPETLFGPGPLVATSALGRVALGDGVEYCITILPAPSGRSTPVAGGRIQRACRDWHRVPVSAKVRSPEVRSLVRARHWPPQVAEDLEAAMSQVRVGDRRNALRALFWDSGERLWVRVVDTTDLDIHPWLAPFADDAGSLAHWDVLLANGELWAELYLPSRFVPSDASAGFIYGVAEWPDEEIGVARIRLAELASSAREVE